MGGSRNPENPETLKLPCHGTHPSASSGLMFDELSAKLTSALQKLTGRGTLTEESVREGLREVRRILLEADVSFDLTREFLERVQAKAVGQDVLKSVRPGQQVVKIVYDELVALLGEKQAAIDQLQQLGTQVQVGVHAEPGVTDVPGIVKRGVEAAGKARARTVIIDTAGRLQIDEQLMDELRAGKAAAKPHEVLLVADGMTGQDAVRIATGFHEALGVTGVILTKMDGDARGGAALSIYGATKAPIKYVGTGEKTDALEHFHPERMAGRILQQGDILSLVEKAQAN